MQSISTQTLPLQSVTILSLYGKMFQRRLGGKSASKKMERNRGKKTKILPSRKFRLTSIVEMNSIQLDTPDRKLFQVYTPQQRSYIYTHKDSWTNILCSNAIRNLLRRLKSNRNTTTPTTMRPAFPYYRHQRRCCRPFVLFHPIPRLNKKLSLSPIVEMRQYKKIGFVIEIYRQILFTQD